MVVEESWTRVLEVYTWFKGIGNLYIFIETIGEQLKPVIDICKGNFFFPTRFSFFEDFFAEIILTQNTCPKMLWEMKVPQ